ncbi:MAG: class B sortase [Peptoniphilaceae bacterium]|nr:class B sortase [Peptoniphilaceae bacterium]MDD7383159.1 class B sortase [Peptoniphilaceae bacterium]MDY3738383.1 class B sortase [Peptoniphilaceae bacterium]
MKKAVNKFIEFILIVIIIGCIAIIGKRGYGALTTKMSEREINKITNSINMNVSQGASEFDIREQKSLAALKKFQQMNQDVKGMIEIPGTWVYYPVMQSDDNEFYLDRDVKAEYSEGGSIFMDAENNSDFSDTNTVIYGHHMWINSMFTALDEFRKQDFAEKNNVIYITDNDGMKEYHVFSAYGTPADYDYRTLEFSDPDEKIEYLNKLKNKSEVSLDSGEFNKDSQIITLSTCAYDFDDWRLAVHAVRVK